MRSLHLELLPDHWWMKPSPSKSAIGVNFKALHIHLYQCHWIFRATTYHWVEKLERLLRLAHQEVSNSYETSQIVEEGQKRDISTRRRKLKREPSFCAVSNCIACEKGTLSKNITLCATYTNKYLFIYNRVANVLEHFEEAVGNMGFGTLSASKNRLLSSLLAALETLIVRTVRKFITSLQFISRILNTVCDIQEFTAKPPLLKLNKTKAYNWIKQNRGYMLPISWSRRKYLPPPGLRPFLRKQLTANRYLRWWLDPTRVIETIFKFRLRWCLVWRKIVTGHVHEGDRRAVQDDSEVKRV